MYSVPIDDLKALVYQRIAQQGSIGLRIRLEGVEVVAISLKGDSARPGMCNSTEAEK
jgi:hypothetical protein